MNKIVLLLLTLLFFNQCNTNKSSYLLIEYSLNEVIEEGEFIQIDDLKFTHILDMDQIIDDDLSLSTTVVYKFIPGDEKKLQTRVAATGIATDLGSKLLHLNKTKLKNRSYKYQINNKMELLTSSKLIISRSDGKKIDVKFSENYPAKIVRAKKLELLK